MATVNISQMHAIYVEESSNGGCRCSAFRSAQEIRGLRDVLIRLRDGLNSFLE